ncbi:MAG TPA: hypothetical protein VGD31_17335 [Sphingobacteriaceae bacterium]
MNISEIKKQYREFKREYGKLLQTAPKGKVEEFIRGLYKESLKATLMDHDHDKANALTDIIEELSPILLERFSYYERLAMIMQAVYDMSMDIKRDELAESMGAHRIAMAGIISVLEMLLMMVEDGQVDEVKSILRNWIPDLYQQLELIQDLEVALLSNDTKALNKIQARIGDMLQEATG